jgi:hypothetical protein
MSKIQAHLIHLAGFIHVIDNPRAVCHIRNGALSILQMNTREAEAHFGFRIRHIPDLISSILDYDSMTPIG